MPISLKLPEPAEMVKRKSFSLPKQTSDLFDLYIEAAKSSDENCTESMILQAVIEKLLHNDKEFKKWLKSRKL